MPDPDITSRPIAVGEPFDPSTKVVGLAGGTGEASFVARPDGRPARIDGFIQWSLTRDTAL